MYLVSNVEIVSIAIIALVYGYRIVVIVDTINSVIFIEVLCYCCMSLSFPPLCQVRRVHVGIKRPQRHRPGWR